MQKDIRRRHDAHVRASSVCNEHSGLFDAMPGGQKNRVALSTSVADVDRLLAVQQRSFEERRAAVAQCRATRRAIHDAVKGVVTIGRLVTVAGDPMGTMQVPGSVSDDELLAYTRGLLDRVSTHVDAFAAEGLPPHLLTNLANGIQELTAARDARGKARGRFAAAAAAIRHAQDRARKTIAALEVIAVNTPAASPEVVTKLRIAKRVGPHVGPRVEAAAQPVPAPSPTPPSTRPTEKAA